MINCLLMDLSSDQDRFTFRILYERTINRFLAIAKSIVTNNNGTIKAFSKDGKTIFRINLKK